MQIVADAYEDLDTFQVAAAYAQAGSQLFTGESFPDYRNQR